MRPAAVEHRSCALGLSARDAAPRPASHCAEMESAAPRLFREPGRRARTFIFRAPVTPTRSLQPELHVHAAMGAHGAPRSALDSRRPDCTPARPAARRARAPGGRRRREVFRFRSVARQTGVVSERFYVSGAGGIVFGARRACGRGDKDDQDEQKALRHVFTRAKSLRSSSTLRRRFCSSRLRSPRRSACARAAAGSR